MKHNKPTHKQKLVSEALDEVIGFENGNDGKGGVNC